MSDHIARVRKQAEWEAVVVFGKQREADLLPADYYQAGQISGYIMGQIALASRLTREKIQDELTGHWYFSSLERCDCGWDQPTAADTSYDGHLADAILALLTEEE